LIREHLIKLALEGRAYNLSVQPDERGRAVVWARRFDGEVKPILHFWGTGEVWLYLNSKFFGTRGGEKVWRSIDDIDFKRLESVLGLADSGGESQVSKKLPNKRYAWELAWEIINQFVEDADLVHLHRAWVFTQLTIKAQAELYRPRVDADTALAMAWEDFSIACRGLGEPGISGPVFQIISRLPNRLDKPWAQMLTEAFDAALSATPPSVLRYHPKTHMEPIATQANTKFGQPEHTPRDASLFVNNVPPVDMGVAAKSPTVAVAKPVTTVSPTVLTLVPALEGQPDEPRPKVIRRTNHLKLVTQEPEQPADS
jgi:hypothetical protein